MNTEGVRICTACEVPKGLDAFYSKATGRNGLTTECKVCQCAKVAAYRAANPEKARNAWRRSSYRKKFGIELEDYNSMFETQAGRCAICGCHQSELSRALAVDHDHETGAVRELLCPKCNIGVDAFRDSPELLEAAIQYLVKHEKT